MTIYISPRRRMAYLRDAMNSLVDESLAEAPNNEREMMLAVDVLAEDEAYTIKALIPGLDAEDINIEVLNNKAGQVSAQAKVDQISGSNRLETIVIDDEHFMWKFNGEYWKDELGFYRFRVRSKCPRKGN